MWEHAKRGDKDAIAKLKQVQQDYYTFKAIQDTNIAFFDYFDGVMAITKKLKARLEEITKNVPPLEQDDRAMGPE